MFPIFQKTFLMKNRVALVTGGSRGIGLGIATCLAQAGWDLAINGVRPDSEIKDILANLGQWNNDVHYIQGDIGNADDRMRIVEDVFRQFQNVHALVNNAGIAPRDRKDLLDMDEASYDRVIDINLKGTFFLSQSFARKLLESHPGEDRIDASIVMISSISADTASVQRGQYCISKAGLSMVTKLFAVRMGEVGVPVYEVRPGIIKTDMTAAVREKYDRLFEQGIAIEKRWGSPEDVGKVVAALLRRDLPYATGQVINVDGGFSISRL